MHALSGCVHYLHGCIAQRHGRISLLTHAWPLFVRDCVRRFPVLTVLLVAYMVPYVAPPPFVNSDMIVNNALLLSSLTYRLRVEHIYCQ